MTFKNPAECQTIQECVEMAAYIMNEWPDSLLIGTMPYAMRAQELSGPIPLEDQPLSTHDSPTVSSTQHQDTQARHTTHKGLR